MPMQFFALDVRRKLLQRAIELDMQDVQEDARLALRRFALAATHSDDGSIMVVRDVLLCTLIASDTLRTVSGHALSRPSGCYPCERDAELLDICTLRYSFRVCCEAW
jgi:hypothetical protein